MLCKQGACSVLVQCIQAYVDNFVQGANHLLCSKCQNFSFSRFFKSFRPLVPFNSCKPQALWQIAVGGVESLAPGLDITLDPNLHCGHGVFQLFGQNLRGKPSIPKDLYLETMNGLLHAVLHCELLHCHYSYCCKVCSDIKISSTLCLNVFLNPIIL